jgi:hypothetical protein
MKKILMIVMILIITITLMSLENKVNKKYGNFLILNTSSSILRLNTKLTTKQNVILLKNPKTNQSILIIVKLNKKSFNSRINKKIIKFFNKLYNNFSKVKWLSTKNADVNNFQGIILAEYNQHSMKYQISTSKNNIIFSKKLSEIKKIFPALLEIMEIELN